jgi:hypothetical protein
MAARYALGPAGAAHRNVQPSLRSRTPYGVLIPHPLYVRMASKRPHFSALHGSASIQLPLPRHRWTRSRGERPYSSHFACSRVGPASPRRGPRVYGVVLSQREVSCERHFESGPLPPVSAASLGNSPDTLVRLLISLFWRSTMLDVRRRRRCVAGRAKTARPSGRFSSIHTASLAAFLLYLSTCFEKLWDMRSYGTCTLL